MDGKRLADHSVDRRSFSVISPHQVPSSSAGATQTSVCHAVPARDPVITAEPVAAFLQYARLATRQSFVPERF
jgi:hypothetical protein